MSNTFQNGFANSITVRGIPLSQAYPGEVFYVSNSSVPTKSGVAGSDGSSSGSYNRPFATIDYAIGKCVASRGDIIAVLPGYTQTLTAASDIALDKAGIAIVGLGAGTLRPQLSYTGTAATVVISAANCAVVGLDFIAAVANAVTAVSVTAAGTGASFESCLFTESANNLNWLACVTLTTLAHDQSFRNCTFLSNDEFLASFITGAAHDRLHIEDCRFYCNATQDTVTALVVGSDITSGLIKNSSFQSANDGAKFIGFSGTCTGIMRDCAFSSLDTAGAISDGFVNSGFLALNCWVSGDANGWAILGGGNAVYS
jgi:hypothetical protein